MEKFLQEMVTKSHKINKISYVENSFSPHILIVHYGIHSDYCPFNPRDRTEKVMMIHSVNLMLQTTFPNAVLCSFVSDTITLATQNKKYAMEYGKKLLSKYKSLADCPEITVTTLVTSITNPEGETLSYSTPINDNETLGDDRLADNDIYADIVFKPWGQDWK